jgi:hypothetical protein
MPVEGFQCGQETTKTARGDQRWAALQPKNGSQCLPQTQHLSARRICQQLALQPMQRQPKEEAMVLISTCRILLLAHEDEEVGEGGEGCGKVFSSVFNS